jgi:hypothetical protein
MIPENLLLPVLAFAASWGGVRVSLNGTKKRVEDIDKNVRGIDVRVARIEGRLGVEPADSST